MMFHRNLILAIQGEGLETLLEKPGSVKLRRETTILADDVTRQNWAFQRRWQAFMAPGLSIRALAGPEPMTSIEASSKVSNNQSL